MDKQYLIELLNLYVRLGDYSERTRIVAMVCLTIILVVHMMKKRTAD